MVHNEQDKLDAESDTNIWVRNKAGVEEGLSATKKRKLPKYAKEDQREVLSSIGELPGKH